MKPKYEYFRIYKAYLRVLPTVYSYKVLLCLDINIYIKNMNSKMNIWCRIKTNVYCQMLVEKTFITHVTQYY